MSHSPLRGIAFAVTLALLLPASALAQQYHRTDLTTDASTVSPSAPNVDPDLVNPWGLARGSGSPWWVSDNGTGLSTLYNATGVKVLLQQGKQPSVVIPTPDGTGTAAPTGTVVNTTSGFLVGPNAKAFFLFVTEDGTISGWNPTVSPNAVLVKNRAGKAIYKGCTIGITPSGRAFFYATNFQTGRVEIYDSNFHRINSGDDDAFRLPGLSKNWSPFNIQNIGGNLVVTFAHRAPGSHDEDHGAGLGHAGVFDLSGRLLLRLKDGPWFNAPWGVALAPGDFGKFTHRLLIGNFGDGTINAFNAFTGAHEGAMLDDTTGQMLSIGGLWAISFGGDATINGTATTLYFSAGANDEADGIFGKLTAVGTEQPGNSQ
jgi:uncharacterized protein (TIGR03118 family)